MDRHMRDSEKTTSKMFHGRFRRLAMTFKGILESYGSVEVRPARSFSGLSPRDALYRRRKQVKLWLLSNDPLSS